MRHFLAIDSGSSHIRVALLNELGEFQAFGMSGLGNSNPGGGDAKATALEAALYQVFSTFRAPIAGITIALAHNAQNTAPQLQQTLYRCGFNAPTIIQPDLLATFCSGTTAPSGYLLFAGEGATSARVENFRLAQVADGLGWLLGDRGSEFWIGLTAVRMVIQELRQHSAGRNHAALSELSSLLCQYWGISTRTPYAQQVDFLITRTYTLGPAQIAAVTPLVFQAAHAGDSMSQRILFGAGQELWRSFQEVLLPHSSHAPLVLSGNLLSSESLVLRALSEALPPEQPAFLAGDNLIGVASLTLRAAGVQVTDETAYRIAGTLASIRF